MQAIFWYRRDLRLADNRGLAEALNGDLPVQPLFIFDREILDKLDDQNDLRVNFIHQTLALMQKQLGEKGSSLRVEYGRPLEVWAKILKEQKVKRVYANHDYEPYAMQRDQEVHELLEENGVEFHTFKDQVIFEQNEITKDDGGPYTVYTPYKKKWLKAFDPKMTNAFSLKLKNLQPSQHSLLALEEMGFQKKDWVFPERKLKTAIIKTYEKTRDLPADPQGTSLLGIHLRFGTVSVRRCVQMALQLNETWLSELIWREFFMQVLFHFPHVVSQSFRPAYDKIPWINDPKNFQLWCEGQTGYPLVDAGMRELNQTGHMHNRVRMVVASFLTKHLLIDWRWGESYFASKLLDFDLASNNGNWQWAAGTGCDAAPYFRVFNPTSQQKKFDPQFIYIKKWVPEYESLDYPEPMIDHALARQRALDTYKKALKA